MHCLKVRHSVCRGNEWVGNQSEVTSEVTDVQGLEQKPVSFPELSATCQTCAVSFLIPKTIDTLAFQAATAFSAQRQKKAFEPNFPSALHFAALKTTGTAFSGRTFCSAEIVLIWTYVNLKAFPNALSYSGSEFLGQP